MGIWRYLLHLRMIKVLIGMIVILIILWSELIRSLSRICTIQNLRRKRKSRDHKWEYILIEGRIIDLIYKIRKIRKEGSLIVSMRKIFRFLPSIIPLKKRWKRKSKNQGCHKMHQTKKRKRYRKKQRELYLPSEKVKNHKYNIPKSNNLIQTYKLRTKDGLVSSKECKECIT